MASKPQVTVVIRARDEGPRIGDALEALRHQDHAPAYEILLVDCGSTDDTVAIARRYGARVIPLERQCFSFGRALNLGAEAAEGEYLVHLSADAVPVGAGYLSTLVAPLGQDGVAATYSRQLPGPGCCPSEARDLEAWFPPRPRPLSRPFLSNASAAVRRSVWQRHRFNEEVASAEDAIWASQVTAAGYTIVYVPAAAVRHSHSASPHIAYRRGRRDADGLRQVDPTLRRFGLWRMLRMAGGLSWLDWRFALRHGYGVWWWPHIAFYRLAQAWGIYQGAGKE